MHRIIVCALALAACKGRETAPPPPPVAPPVDAIAIDAAVPSIFTVATPIVATTPLPPRFAMPLPATEREHETTVFPPDVYVERALAADTDKMRERFVDAMKRAIAAGAIPEGMQLYFRGRIGLPNGSLCAWMTEIAKTPAIRAVIANAQAICTLSSPKVAPPTGVYDPRHPPPAQPDASPSAIAAVADLAKGLDALGFVDRGSRMDETEPSSEIEVELAARGYLYRFDNAIGLRRNEHERLLVELAAFGGPALEPVIFVEEPGKLVAYAGGKSYTVPADLDGPQYDVVAMIGLVNAILVANHDPTRFAAITSEEKTFAVLVGPGAAITKLVDAKRIGLLSAP